MQRDLYGELLSRALNRGAPPGHFAAYITPQEGNALRSMGGGVAPGGGQFMFNGVPSYFGPEGPAGDADAGTSGTSPSEQGDDPTGGLGAASGLSGGGDDASFGLERAISEAAAQDAADRAAAANIAAGTIGFEPERQEFEKTLRSAPLHAQAKANIGFISSNPRNMNKDGSFNERGVAALGRNISEGGTGFQSPASVAARNNASLTPEQAQTINQQSDRTGGYAINDPFSDVSVPKGLNMGLIPAALGTVAGFVNPLASLGMYVSGYPTLGTMAIEGLKADPGILGTATRGLQQGISTITQPVRNVLSPARQIGASIGKGIRNQVSGIGDFITQDIIDPLSSEITQVVDQLGSQIPGMPNMNDLSGVLSPDQPGDMSASMAQQGSNQQMILPEQVAPIVEPFVSEPESSDNYYVPPQDIQNRLLANALLGRQRTGLV